MSIDTALIDPRHITTCLQLMAVKANTGIFLAQNGVIVWVNDFALQLFGYVREEVIGKVEFFNLVPLARRPEAEDIYRRRLAGEEVPATYEMPILKKDGTEVNCRLTNMILKIDGQEYLGGFVYDITSTIEAKRIAVQTSARLYGLLDAIAYPVIIYAPTREVVYVNPAFTRLYGWTLAELQGRLIDFVPPEELQKTIGIWEKTISQGSANFKTVRRTKNRRLIDVLIHSSIVRGPDGEHVESIVVHHDITAQLAAEHALRLSEALYRQTFEDAPVGIFRFDVEGVILACNAEFARIKGAPSEELIGACLSNTQLAAAIQRTLSGQNGRYEGACISIAPAVTKTTPVAIDLRPLLDEHGQVIGGLGIVVDQTEKLQAEAKNKTIFEQLLHAQKMETLGRLAAGVAHDLNHSLTTVSGLTELARKQTGEDLARSLHSITEVLGKMARLSQRLTDFSRQKKLEMKRVDLRNLVISFCQDVLAELSQNQRKLLIDLCDESCWIWGDESALSQSVLANLVVNAKDATGPGGKIEVGLKRVKLFEGEIPGLDPGDYCVLSVVDDGSGIDSAVITKIFEPFFTTKQEGIGTGLGLSTAFGLAQDHQGILTVSSKLGEGTCFSLFLPALAGETKHAPQKDICQTEQMAQGIERILLVDDESGLRGMMQVALESCGYQVQPASGGEEAWLLYQADSTFDLVITDVEMPDFNGCKLARLILEQNSDQLLVVMSGHALDILVTMEKELGAIPALAHFLYKRFNLVDLSKMVRSVLDSKKS